MDLYDSLIEDAKTPADLLKLLEYLISMDCDIIVSPSGDLRVFERRQLVHRVGNLKIEIFSREHAPPHFHLTGPDIDATFSIDDGTLLTGSISSTQRKRVDFWYHRSREKLIEVWNQTRPSDCPVGKISEG